MVFGTRPEAIKMAPLVKAFQKSTDIFDTKICVTGQHRQMLDQVLEVFDRRENFGDGFLNICRALKTIALSHPEIDIVYPVHLNPNVKKPVFELLAGLPNVYLLTPIDYLPFIYLMQHAYLILTDSGGIQEEAPSLGKPVFVMRDTTERPEAVEAGTVKLVGTDADTIIDNVNSLLIDPQTYNQMVKSHNPYGDGRACERIVDVMKNMS